MMMPSGSCSSKIASGSVFGFEKPNRVVDLGQGCLGQFVGLLCAVGQEAVEFGLVAHQFLGALADWFDSCDDDVGYFSF